MSTGKLYSEAINETRDLVRMAEETARNKVIDAISPRIKKLIESRLLNEEGEGDDELDDLFGDDTGEDAGGDDSPEVEPGADESGSEDVLPDTAPAPIAPAPAAPGGGYDLRVPGEVKKVTLQTEADKSVRLDPATVSTLLRIVDTRASFSERARELQLELRIVRRELDVLNGRGTKQVPPQLVEGFNAVLKKAIGLKQELADSPLTPATREGKEQLERLNLEIKEMVTKTLLKNLLSENRGRVNEAADDEEVDVDDVDAGGEEEMDVGGEDVDIDVDAVKTAVADLAGAVGMTVTAPEGGEEDLEMGTEDMDGEEEEVEEEGMEETVYEIDESVLRKELLRLRKARALREAAGDEADQFGGGKSEGDAFEDPAELNKLGEGEEEEGEKEKVDESDDEEDKSKIKEARYNRVLRSRLAEAAKAVQVLTRQLSEQKLFNAKLLYLNKLMRTGAISERQLKAVVEALDSARTIGEAKLLYKGLSESLARSDRSLTEGAKRTQPGGSSRPTGRAGASLNESVELDRWGVLAGLGNKK